MLLVTVCCWRAIPSPAASEAPLWNLAWITDTQTADCEWIAALLRAVSAHKPKMILHTGDTRFEWANQCAWRDVMGILKSETPAIEFHLAPGNHDLQNGVLKYHLRQAATEGIYRLDTGRIAAGQGYYHNRIPDFIMGPLWPTWNPEVLRHPAWQSSANTQPAHYQHPEIPYRYVFERGGIRFIVCDCYTTEEQCQWVRDLITQPDDSSVSILLQHEHEVEKLAPYFEGLEGRHNVKLVLTGHHHHYLYEQRHGATFITAAGMARGSQGDSDAMTLWIYPDRIQLDRYVIPKEAPARSVTGPTNIWTCSGVFSAYERPASPVAFDLEEDQPNRQGNDAKPATKIPPSEPQLTSEARGSRVASLIPSQTNQAIHSPTTLGPNLLFNGDFDNHVWYERFRGWSPSGWYQWFTRGGHAPEHAVGRYPSPPHPAHTGKEYVRIHMWGHAWRGGILQVVRGVEPGHHYRLTAYGFFQPKDAPEPHERIGLDPCGGLADQFSVDVTKHPAPKYDEGIGDDPKTPGFDGPGFADTTIWSAYQDYSQWGKFEVTAEARSDTMTVILCCAPKQRPADKPIYEMNWDSVSLVEIPWPAPRLIDESAELKSDSRIQDLKVTVQAQDQTAQVTWETKMPAGASQVIYRFLSEKAIPADRPAGSNVRSAGFPGSSPVTYERGARRHWITLGQLSIPEIAKELEVVALSRICENGACKTICSAPRRLPLR